MKTSNFRDLRAERDELTRARAECTEARSENSRLRYEIAGTKQRYAAMRRERDEARADARMWMDRYSSLFVRVACGVTPGTTERDIFYAWQREVDEAYQVAALKDAK